AGEEAANSLQTLVQAAGSGQLQKLLSELKKSQGEALKAAKVMADNLGGDLKNLDSAWEGFRIQVEETTDGPLRKLTQNLSEVITAASEWVKANPRLAQTLLLVVGGALALAVAIGALSLAVGILIGPLAKLQLGFTLLTGGRGILGTVAALRTFGTATGPVMATMKGWRAVLSGVQSGFGGILVKISKVSAVLPAMRSALMGAFLAPGAALASFGKSFGMFLLRFSGLKMLGGVLSFLLSPIGLIGAAFIAAGLLIWRYWEPLKAFFTGLFTGVMQALSPLRDSFAAFSPILESVGDGVKSVWQWFTNLLSPIQTSKDTLDKCASAGSTFGNVLGGALQVVLIPAKALLDTLAWILEKLGVLPDEAERARKKIEDAQRMSLLQDKVAFLQGDMLKVAPKKTDSPVIAVPPPSSSPLSGDTGTQRRLNSIADNTKATANNTKKIGPGDIVFKNLPRALALRGAYQEARVIPQPVPRVSAAAAGGVLSVPTATQGATSAPVAASSGAA
ncbi:phage tail tape measure protein, partial [Klebsiella pneumoniae]